jgi:hypothetical protein
MRRFSVRPPAHSSRPGLLSACSFEPASKRHAARGLRPFRGLRDTGVAQQTLSHSALLRRRMQVTCSPLYEAYRRFWASEDLALLLPAFLILMHQIVRASVPLMEAARSEARVRSSGAVHRRLAAYLSTHIRDERRHDEWLRVPSQVPPRRLGDGNSRGHDGARLGRQSPIGILARLLQIELRHERRVEVDRHDGDRRRRGFSGPGLRRWSARPACLRPDGRARPRISSEASRMRSRSPPALR